MFKFIRNLVCCALCIVIMLAAFFGAGQLIPNQYIKSYTAGIEEKYQMYTDPERKPSVILVGGSNLGFGMNCEKASEMLGENVINIGLHAGLKREFELNLAKENVKKGDVIVLALEYSAYIEDKMSEVTTWYAVDTNYKVMKFIPLNNWFNLIRYYPIYLFKKTQDFFLNKYPEPSNEAYSRKYFDKYGDNKFDRPVNVRSADELVRSIHISKDYVSDESMSDLKEFKEFCESKGAKVYMSAPSVDELTVITNKKQISEFEKYVYEKTGIEQISSVSDYVMDTKYFYDTNYHLNNSGVEHRTELLVNDLKKVL